MGENSVGVNLPWGETSIIQLEYGKDFCKNVEISLPPPAENEPSKKGIIPFMYNLNQWN